MSCLLGIRSIRELRREMNHKAGVLPQAKKQDGATTRKEKVGIHRQKQNYYVANVYIFICF